MFLLDDGFNGCESDVSDMNVQGAAASLGLETHPKYWACVRRAVACGWNRTAEELLGSHSVWQRMQLMGSASPSSGTPHEPEVGALEVLEAFVTHA